MKVKPKNIIEGPATKWMQRLGGLMILALLNAPWSNAQTVLLERDVRVDTQQSSIGPNRKHHVQLMLGLGNFFGGGHAAMPIRYGSSREFFIGAQYKRKINASWSFGGDFSFRNMLYRIDQNAGRKSIPDTVIYDRERFSLPQFALQPWLRYNFDRKRGDRLGLYLDVAPGFHLPVSHRRVVVFKTSETDHTVKVVEKRLDYFNAAFATLSLRAGYQRFAVYGQWRGTPIVNAGKSRDRWGQAVDFPPYLLGLQVAFY